MLSDIGRDECDEITEAMNSGAPGHVAAQIMVTMNIHHLELFYRIRVANPI